MSAPAALSAVGRAGPFGDVVDLRPSQPPVPTPSPAYTAPRPMTVRTLQAPDFSLLHTETQFLAGVRPYREGGMRLGLRPPVEVGNARKIVIHNYRHGGAGMSLAFGVAERVRDLVARASTQHLDGERTPAIAVLGAGVMGLAASLAPRSGFPERGSPSTPWSVTGAAPRHILPAVSLRISERSSIPRARRCETRFKAISIAPRRG